MGGPDNMNFRNVKSQMLAELEGIRRDVKMLSSKLDGYSIIYAADTKAIEAAQMKLEECMMWATKAMT
jgi:hypothetical protein